MQGTVLGGTNNTFSVECEDGVTRLCSIKGKQLKSDTRYYNPLAPGDVVKVEKEVLGGEKGQMLELLNSLEKQIRLFVFVPLYYSCFDNQVPNQLPLTGQIQFYFC